MLKSIIKNNLVNKFIEKPKGEAGWVNGGFFVLSKGIFKYISKSNCTWEKEPLEMLARNKQLDAFKFDGFWYAMDTLRDKNYLEDLWSTGKAPWKTWNES